MNALGDLAVTVEHVKICQEVTGVNADQDFWGTTAKQVGTGIYFYYEIQWLLASIKSALILFTIDRLFGDAKGNGFFFSLFDLK